MTSYTDKLGKVDGKASVSVVIPCYCCSETINRTLASVAEQTMLPYEVLLIEDASPDQGKTREALHRLVDQYGDIFAVKLILMGVNGGAASARNAGWTIATQPYIAFLDSDDAWHPQKIECQYKYMQAYPDVVLCGHTYRILRASEKYSREKYTSVLYTATARAIRPLNLLLSNPFVTPSVMVKSDIPFRFMPGKRYTDDHLLWMEIALAGLKVVKLPTPLALIDKALYGEGGLSSHMWAMEKGELHNYWHLHKTGRIGLPMVMGLMTFSLAKYMRRIVIMGTRRVSAWTRQRNKEA